MNDVADMGWVEIGSTGPSCGGGDVYGFSKCRKIKRYTLNTIAKSQENAEASSTSPPTHPLPSPIPRPATRREHRRFPIQPTPINPPYPTSPPTTFYPLPLPLPPLLLLLQQLIPHHNYPRPLVIP